MPSTLTVALVGNPNCGKTTLFNALTGARQTVGNWPGVTVERKSGYYYYQEQQIEVVDLPGVYAMDAITGHIAIDQKITHDYVLSNSTAVIINIIDAANLERNLYLTIQLLELGRPVVIALNMMDVATQKGISIDVDMLASSLACAVIPINARSGAGIAALKSILNQTAAAKTQQPELIDPPIRVNYPAVKAISELAAVLPKQDHIPVKWQALKLLEGDDTITKMVDQKIQTLALNLRRRVEEAMGEDLDILIADARYRFIGTIAATVVQRSDKIQGNLNAAIDKIVLNRWLGLPIFLLVIYTMFLFTINIGGAFIDFFDLLFGAVLVTGVGMILAGMGTPDWLTIIVADGAGGGVQTVATFIPIIGLLFLFMSFLEDSGYMARAAFVTDRLMRAIGLPGKTFIPMIVGLGCNVPAILATRTLEHHRDRLVSMAMTPFMSCGARLPVYALFAAAFFPSGGQNLVFLLYLIGIMVAILTAVVLKGTILPETGAHFVMELPAYHLPTINGMLIHTWERLRGFITKAGTIIVPMVLALNILNSLGTDGNFGHQNTDNSVLAAIGKGLVPLFHPLGVQEHNWPAAVGIFTGILAKEAVVGTLDTLYSQQATVDEAAVDITDTTATVSSAHASTNLQSIGNAIIAALATIPHNLAKLGGSLLDPLGLNIGDISDIHTAAALQEVQAKTFGAMAKAFDGQTGAFAYLLLILLYFPCVAVLGAIYRESGLTWAFFVSLWSTGLGFTVATIYYQLATFAAHPLQSTAWSGGLLLLLIAIIYGMRYLGQRLDLMDYPLINGVTKSSNFSGIK